MALLLAAGKAPNACLSICLCPDKFKVALALRVSAAILAREGLYAPYRLDVPARSFVEGKATSIDGLRVLSSLIACPIFASIHPRLVPFGCRPRVKHQRHRLPHARQARVPPPGPPR